MTLDLSSSDMNRLIEILRALQSPLRNDWLLSEPALAQDLQSMFGADFIGSSRWDQASGQFRDAHCIGRDQIMSADYEREFQFCDPITPLVTVPTVAPGCPKIGWFGTLKNSDRKSTRTRSVTRNCLARETSSAAIPGPTTLFRPLLPKRYGPTPVVKPMQTVILTLSSCGPLTSTTTTRSSTRFAEPGYKRTESRLATRPERRIDSLHDIQSS